MEDREDYTQLPTSVPCWGSPSPPQKWQDRWYVCSLAEAVQAVTLMGLPSAPVYITM